LFQDSVIDNPLSRLYLKLSQEHRRNQVKTGACSDQMMIRSIGEDTMYAAKIGIKINENFVENMIMDSLNLHGSLALKTNFLN